MTDIGVVAIMFSWRRSNWHALFGANMGLLNASQDIHVALVGIAFEKLL